MESINSTTFLTLPTILQLHIVKLTSWKDQKNLRLVSNHTLALVNYLGASSTFLDVSNGNPFLFQRLKICPFSSINGLALGDLTAPLPIKSSTRLLIPKTNYLNIGSNISTENIFKLTRYYMKYCKRLHFFHTNLPFIKNITQFGPSQSCLVNVKTFSINFIYRPNAPAGDFQQRLNSFGQFLVWCSMPSLLELVLFIKQDEDISYSLVPLPKGNRFYENLQQFLIKHGSRLHHLKLVLCSSSWVTIMPTFECMVNLEKFEIYYAGGTSLNSIDYDVVCKGFNHFAKLKSIRMDSGNGYNFEFASLLLSNNQNTIQSLDLENIISSFDWLYEIPASFHNLTYLALKIRYEEDSTIFSQQTYINFKLDSLYKLTIHFDSYVHACGRGQQGAEKLLDWHESFINWLFGFSPNLQELKLTHFNKILRRISFVLLMIRGLTRLRRITFESYHEHEFRGFPIWPLQNQPYNTTYNSSELQNLLKSNPQIEDDLYRYKCVVNINRPYISGQQREGKKKLDF